MLARKRLPRPSPLLAPSTRPPMSTNCTLAGTTLRLADMAASASSRRARTLGAPTLGARGAKARAVAPRGAAEVGVAGGEGVGRAQRAPAGERVVQRRLARVGETDEP